MLDQTKNLPENATEILGDLAALAEQLGQPDGLCALPPSSIDLLSTEVRTPSELRTFLAEYSTQVLVAHELPAIATAYGHVTRYEVRELIAQDQSLAKETPLLGFARASRTIGQAQLLRLRPLRGERVVQRYVAAVESGQANAWHTLVYGLVLALYSIPLRQGLLHFAQQTLAGYARAASRRFPLSNSEASDLWRMQASSVQTEVDAILSRQVLRSS